ncbi:MAG: ribosomal-protein-alanine N-acetyltransferase [Methanosphaera sp. rholeuAM6]|nr:MAG: ribosomal-protein-alanine N-acetyltransferase [Methanosphaera sp. rholeuAM6]
MIIRDFKLSDIDDVLAIEYESFPDPYPVDILLQLHNSGAGFIVAQLGKHVVGYVIFWIRNRIGHIIAIAVDSKYRNMHVGSLMIEKTLKIFFSNNINTVGLEVRKSNTAAVNFYLKHGFVKVSEEEDYYNDGESAIIMHYTKADN